MTSVKDYWMLKFLDLLFWVFLIATVLHVIFLVVIPTPTEWPKQFPYDVKWWEWEFWAPFLRHLSLFNEHFPIVGFIDIINGAFLTMFVNKIGTDVRSEMENENPKGKMPMSTYVEWAMGALFSGIIFASARLAVVDVVRASVYIIGIFFFSFVAYYFLYRLRQKLRAEEEKPRKSISEE